MTGHYDSTGDFSEKRKGYLEFLFSKFFVEIVQLQKAALS